MGLFIVFVYLPKPFPVRLRFSINISSLSSEFGVTYSADKQGRVFSLHPLNRLTYGIPQKNTDDCWPALISYRSIKVKRDRLTFNSKMRLSGLSIQR